ncbi:MFS transporter [Opitutus sp. ER46]|uniref:MFS transporter n=1 Tax=Opitutus sp. ER46 TaxID=2161864 RepID=UPI000D314FB7|nr:MFS transporter [Opitutus sp. ER46]PTX94495.1 MFS transporter [Opitutus sp. ER46]
MTEERSGPLTKAWLTVAVLWVVALLNYLDRLMITTMRDPIKADIAMTDAQFGLLTSVFLWTYGVFSPFGGYLADRFSRRWVIVASVFIWSAVTWATGHMHSLQGMLISRAVMGLSEACYIPAALALISDLHPGRTRSLATGLHMSGVYAGAALGGVGGVIAEHWGWRIGFYGFGLFGIGYALVCLWIVRDVPPAAAKRGGEVVVDAGTPGLGRALGELVRHPAFLILLGVNALVGVANWGIYGWLPTYLREHFQLGLGAAGMTATGYIQVASFLGVLLGGIWADRWSRSQPRARALVPAIGFCVVGPALFLGINGGTLLLAVAGLVVYGLGRGFFDANLMPITRTIVDERYSATGYGLLNFVSVSMGGLMIYVGGWLKDAKVDLGLIFQVSAAGLLLVGVMLFAVTRAKRA